MAETTSEWSDVIVTSLGLRLDSKVKAGLTGFRATKVTVGDGFIADGDDPLSFTALKHQVPTHQSGTEADTATADITIIRAVDTGMAAVKIRIENGSTAFYLREIGIWAQDPDMGEILYAYTNSGDHAHMLEAYNGRTHVIRRLTVPFLLSNTANISGNCTFAVEVSEEVFNAHKNNTENPHNVTKEQIGLGDVYVTEQLDVLTASGSEDITDYPADTRISQVLGTVTTTWGTATHRADHGEYYYSSYRDYDCEGMDLYIKLYVLSGVLYWDEYYGTPPTGDGIYLGKVTTWGSRGSYYFGITYENPSPAGGTEMSLRDAVIYLLQRINH